MTRRSRYFKETGALDPATAGTVQNIGLMAQKAEEYGSHPTTFEIPEDGTVRMVAGQRRRAARARGGDRATSGAPPRRARRRSRTGCSSPSTGRRPTGCRGDLLAGRTTRAHDAELIAYVKPILEAAGRGRQVPRSWPRARRPRAVARDDPQGRELHRDHRQRAARLPDRPVPDPRTGDLGQDAVHRQADAGRRAVRDRRRRLGPQARAAAGGGEPPALGLPRRVLRAGRKPQVPRRPEATTPRRGCWATRSTPRRRACSTTTGRPSARSASPTTATAITSSRATGRRRWPTQTEDTELAAHFAPVARRWPRTRTKIIAELAEVQGKPVDLGGYYHPDPQKVTAVMRPSATLNGIIG